MKEMDATEESYKNGYIQGVKDFAETLKVKSKCSFSLGVDGVDFTIKKAEIDEIEKNFIEGRIKNGNKNIW